MTEQTRVLTHTDVAEGGPVRDKASTEPHLPVPHQKGIGLGTMEAPQAEHPPGYCARCDADRAPHATAVFAGDADRELARRFVRLNRQKRDKQIGDKMSATATTDSVYEVPEVYGADGSRLEWVIVTDENGRRWAFEFYGGSADPKKVAEHLADADEHERAEWADGYWR